MLAVKKLPALPAGRNCIATTSRQRQHRVSDNIASDNIARAASTRGTQLPAMLLRRLPRQPWRVSQSMKPGETRATHHNSRAAGVITTTPLLR